MKSTKRIGYVGAASRAALRRRPRLGRPTCGFTLVELLVVIAIIGILVALLLPAIQASRETARRVMCTNQIHQLLLAVHDYEMAHEHYPAGTVDAAGPIRNLPKGHHISWIARVLPYMEERLLYEMIDLSLSAYHQKNDRPRQASIPLLICPSCPADEWPYSNYAGCHHDVEAPIDSTNNGVFFINSRLTRDDLKDGSAYTIFLGEKIIEDTDLGWLSGTPATLRNAGSPFSGRTVGRAWSSGAPWVRNYAADYSQWSWDNQQVDPLTGELVTVELPVSASSPLAESVAEKQPTNGESDSGGEPSDQKKPYAQSNSDENSMLKHSKLGGDPTSPLMVGGFGSNHPGGVNFAFGDGSVRFMADDVSASLMGRLAHREDGNIVDARELP
jgi:prepilin-type N-terminal cleavage/methylation domain-containing protein/prepilin-type processing-associated H-X9-DG protein